MDHGASFFANSSAIGKKATKWTARARVIAGRRELQRKFSGCREPLKQSARQARDVPGQFQLQQLRL